MLLGNTRGGAVQFNKSQFRQLLAARLDCHVAGALCMTKVKNNAGWHNSIEREPGSRGYPVLPSALLSMTRWPLTSAPAARGNLKNGGIPQSVSPATNKNVMWKSVKSGAPPRCDAIKCNSAAATATPNPLASC